MTIAVVRPTTLQKVAAAFGNPGKIHGESQTR
jgi:hypothetical protein